MYTNLLVKLQLTEAVCETNARRYFTKKPQTAMNMKNYCHLLILQIPWDQSCRNIQQNSLSIYQRHQGSVSQKDYFKIVCKS